MERNAEPDYEKMEQDIAEVERQLEEELETELKKRLDKDWINVNKVDSKKRKNYTGINMASFWLGVSPWL